MGTEISRVPGLRSVHERVDQGELYQAEEDDNRAAGHPHIYGLRGGDKTIVTLMISAVPCGLGVKTLSS